jgi:hypothetical protein
MIFTPGLSDFYSCFVDGAFPSADINKKPADAGLLLICAGQRTLKQIAGAFLCQ